MVATTARIDRGRINADPTANSPHRFSCEDGNDYVVKPNGNDRQFANESLVLALGTVAGIPLFDAAIVSVSPSFLAASPLAAQRYAVGNHFGSCVPTQAFFNFKNVGPGLVRTYIRNTDSFYTLAMFDELIANGDRAGNAGNIVAVEYHASQPKFDFMAIDHGHAFTGPSWTPEMLERHIPAPVFPVLLVVREILVRRAALTDNASAIAGLLADLEDAIQRAQSGLDDRARAAVLHLITQRAPQLTAWVASPGYAAHLPFLR